MVTHDYDPLSVEHYMKARGLLCNYRASDPFANQKEEDEEKLDEELGEFEGLGDMMEDEGKFFQDLEEGGDTMGDYNSKGMIEEGSEEEVDEDEAEKQEEEDEGLFVMDEDDEKSDEESPEEKERREKSTELAARI
ncbi:hypothetical protein DSL72_001902 [Monilinia vaccinii-corymbosi]|uniref:Uncharacterized protein n=1 Tax=Monilinia vaccinii-corymbosi TaxID=61207 RepID=A0A8A3PB60_9HELO|nr:hypothetical protein DSL72_001902 [Monilinia vaccinii-corymbosi]